MFSRHISRTQSFQQNRHVIFPALVALKLLVSLISRLVACSARIDADKQTNKQTDTQNDYCNPRCACALRVNNQFSLYFCCGGEGQGEGGLKGLGDKIDGLAGGLKGLGEKRGGLAGELGGELLGALGRGFLCILEGSIIN